MNIFGRKHIMVDCETLSTAVNATIVSIGAVAFTFENGIENEFLINVDPRSCVAKGLHVSKDTVEWWKKQPAEARDSWKVNPQPIELALDKWLAFVGNDPKQLIWSQGFFDHNILESACAACGIKWPVKYWNQMDLRTVFTLLGVRNDKIRKTQTGHHSALADAISQTTTLLAQFKPD